MLFDRDLRQHKRNTLLFLGGWSALIFLSLIWNLDREEQRAIQLAEADAKSHLDKDLAFRRWASSLGGFYVPITPRTPPSPHMAAFPERDIRTPGGKQLTLYNPAQAMRMMQSEQNGLYQIQTRIVSEQYLNPHNAPDEWERKALAIVASTRADYSEQIQQQDQLVLRRMQPMWTEEPCQKCHAKRGLKVGDLAGATDVSIPLAPYLHIRHEASAALMKSHGGLWLLGIGLIGLYAWRRNQYLLQAGRNQASLRMLTDAVEQSTNGMYITDTDDSIVYVNAKMLELSGFKQEEVIGQRPEAFVAGGRETAELVAMGKALMAQGVWHNERLFRMKSGANFWCSEKVSAVREPEGNIKHYVTVIEDISERKQAIEKLEQSRNQLNEAQRLAMVGSWSLDLRNNKLHWSDEIFRIFEIDPERFEASYEAFLKTIHPDDVEWVNLAYTASVANRTPYDIIHRLLLAGGRIKHVHERCETLYGQDGTPLLSRGTVQDVTERTLDQESMQLFANVFRHSCEGVLITDQDNRIIAVNPALVEITGFDFDDLEGQNPRLLASGRTPRETYQAMWASLNSAGHWQGELWDRRKNGEVYPKWASISVIRNASGELTNYIASFTDISERKAAEEHIQHLANHDALTGLFNRYSLENRMEQILLSARRDQRILALLFIDLDRFKYINDTLGHPAGDSLLVEIASRLKNSVRESDVVARLGGDEYIVVLNAIDSGEVAASVASKLLTTISQPYLVAGTEVRSGACIGISTYPNDGDDTATLMKHADTAMYHAKKLGRNNFQFFDPVMNAAAGERLLIEQDLHTALREGQFELHYQPKVRASDGQLSGLEALIRWRHPQRGLIPPLKFIPIAEETGQIIAIGDWVLEEACRQQAEWRAQGVPNPQIAVNLSAHQLRSPGLVGWVQRIMQRYAMQPGELELEVTESVAMDAPDKAISLLSTLRDLGLALAIDDFGTGYSSLAYLKLLPIQTLKLDRAFVRDIETDENDAAISAATLALAHNLGLKVVAEGVETEGQRAYLLAHGCDYLQGYLFSKPLPAAEIREFILKGVKG